MLVKLYTQIEVELEIDDMIITHEMTDKTRNYHLANLIQGVLPANVKVTKPKIVSVVTIND